MTEVSSSVRSTRAGNVTTFLGTIATSTNATSTTNGTLYGSYMQPNILQVAMNPKTDAIFYLTASPKGGVDGYSQNWSGTKSTHVFYSLVGSWDASYLSDNRIILLESPQDGVPGYAYTLGANSTLTPLMHDIQGLTLNAQPGGSALVYGSSNGSSLSLFTRATTTPTTATIQTIADKCVWMPGASTIVYCAVPTSAPTGDFLQEWYQGLVSTSDNWWQIDLSSGQETLVYSPSSDGVSLDVQNPVMDPTGTYIAFQNATDESLWVLNVTQ